MKEFVKPEIHVLEIRPEERIAACGDIEDYMIDPGSPGIPEVGAYQLNGTSPNRNVAFTDRRGCWVWVITTPGVPAVPPTFGQRQVTFTES